MTELQPLAQWNSEVCAQHGWEWLPEVNSTNSYLKKKTSSQIPITCIAHRQTQGRGRGGNHWLDGEGQLFLSVLLPLQSQPAHWTSAWVGLQLIETLHAHFACAFSLKPPNDIYLGHKKLAGLLLEGESQGLQQSLIVGLGLNVLHSPAPEFACLQDSVEVTQHTWQTCLIEMVRRIGNLQDCACRPKLSEPERQSLIRWIRLFPQSPYLDMTPEGDLITSAGLVSWRSL